MKNFGDAVQYFTMSGLYILGFLMVKLGNPALVFWIVYVLVPYLDDIIKWDVKNPTQQESRELSQQIKYKLPLYTAVVFDWLGMFFGIKYLVYENPTWINLIFTLFIGITGAGSNINVAHELCHKDNIIDKWLGTFTLAKNLYMHFIIEHIHGHHRNVATPHDPATAMRGETVYHFWWKSVVGSYLSAWNIESKRVQKIYKSGSFLSIHNRMLWFDACYAGLIILMYNLYGLLGVIYFFVMAIGSFLLLETINYVEHYGLQRKEISKGNYEPVNISHSWNAPHHVSNLILFKLQRHSDHHENPYKPYQTLCSYETSPCLPHGYTVCILLAMFPPVWFDVIHDHLKNWQNKKYGVDQETKRKVRSFIHKVGIVSSVIVLLPIIY